MNWTGLRGAVAAALALSIPVGTPDRELLQGTVFGVVLFTLLVQGTTAASVLRWQASRTKLRRARWRLSWTAEAGGVRWPCPRAARGPSDQVAVMSRRVTARRPIATRATDGMASAA